MSYVEASFAAFAFCLGVVIFAVIVDYWDK